jgi:hypothetical protein
VLADFWFPVDLFITMQQGSLEFTSVVSAAFWLVNLPTWMAADAIPMLDKLFRLGLCVSSEVYL